MSKPVVRLFSLRTAAVTRPLEKSRRSPRDLRPVSKSLIQVESIGAVSHAPNDRGLIVMENPGAK